MEVWDLVPKQKSQGSQTEIEQLPISRSGTCGALHDSQSVLQGFAHN